MIWFVVAQTVLILILALKLSLLEQRQKRVEDDMGIPEWWK